MRFFWSILIFFGFVSSALSDTIVEHQSIYSLRNEVFTIIKDTKTAMPLMSNQKTKKAYVVLDQKKYSGYQLSLQVVPEMTIFLDNQLVFRSQEKAQVHLEINEFPPNREGKGVLTFHSPQAPLQLEDLEITKAVTKEVTVEKFLIERFIEGKNVVTIYLILIVGLIALIKNTNATIWAGYFDVRRVFFEKLNKAEYVPKSLFDQESVILVIIVSLLGGVLLHLYGLSLFFGHLTEGLLALMYFFMIMSFLVAKYFVLKLVTWFLSVSSFGNRQFYDFLRFLLWFFIGLLVLKLSFGQDSDWLIQGFFWIGFAFWNLKIFIGALTRLKFQKVYLFSYICASELMPALVLVNFIDTIH